MIAPSRAGFDHASGHDSPATVDAATELATLGLLVEFWQRPDRREECELVYEALAKRPDLIVSTEGCAVWGVLRPRIEASELVGPGVLIRELSTTGFKADWSRIVLTDAIGASVPGRGPLYLRELTALADARQTARIGAELSGLNPRHDRPRIRQLWELLGQIVQEGAQ